MESYDKARTEHSLSEGRDQDENRINESEAKKAELNKTKDELKRAKDTAMQSWLDSRPLIDKLEKLQSGLASAKNRTSMSNIIISDLESQLQATIASIRSKKEEEVNHQKHTISDMNQALDQTHEEMETLKLEMDEERRERSKLKQVLRLRRQTLRTILLTLRAARLESEAFGASAAEALRHINRSEMDTNTVQLTHEDYYALTRRAKEETSLADWRVSVSMEQKLVAEASRDSAVRRFKGIQSSRRSRKRVMSEEKIIGDENITRDGEQDSTIRMRAQVNNRQTPSPKAQAKVNPRNPREQSRRTKSKNNKGFVMKKKPSILEQIRSFLARRIGRLFG